jgi:thiol:disulfide interchange protein DsbD
MTTVKVVLGFLELALALKFLSNADLVKHWGLLKIEPFLVLWIIIFVLLGIYLFGKLRFPHDSPMKKIPIPRAILGVASFAFAIYLMTGFRYDEKAGSLQPLTLLSGLAPPVCYSWFNPCDCPQNLSCFKDFEEGMAYAKKVGKPVMIDFTGHACVNCRKMEETIWPKQPVYKLLDEDYVLISLYVDEKIELPEEEQVTVQLKSGKTRKLRYTGHRWQILQTENFNINSQPFYVLLSPDGTMLNEPVPYTPDVQEYANFLECGLNRFNELEAENKLLGDK